MVVVDRAVLLQQFGSKKKRKDALDTPPISQTFAEFKQTVLRLSHTNCTEPAKKQMFVTPSLLSGLDSSTSFPDQSNNTSLLQTDTPSPSDTPSDSSATPSSSSTSLSSLPSRERPVTQKAAIPRPPNAWILYRSAKLKERSGSEWGAMYSAHNQSRIAIASSSSANPISNEASNGQASKDGASNGGTSSAGTAQGFYSKRVADMWRQESKVVKDHFHELARLKKKRHEEMFPNYRFVPRPRKKEDRQMKKEGSSAAETVTEIGKGKKKCKGEVSTDGKKEKSEITTGSDIQPSLKNNNEAIIDDLAMQTETITAKRPASTAKTKAKGPPELSIDVMAAEKTTDFSFTSFMNMPLTAGNGVEGVDGPIDVPLLSSVEDGAQLEAIRSLFAYDVDKIAALESQGQEKCFGIVQPVFNTPWTGEASWNSNSSWITSATPSTSWKPSPFHLSPLGEVQSAIETVNSRDSWQQYHPSTINFPPLPKATKKREARRKSTSNLGSKKQSKDNVRKSVRATRSSTSPAKKFKRALISKEAKKVKEDREKVKKMGSGGNVNSTNSIPSNADANMAMDQSKFQLGTLVRSYDRQGASDSDVEGALLCADALIESFATMAAWSPNESWFSGLKSGDNLASEDHHVRQEVGSPAWNFYSQEPSQEIVSTLSRYEWPVTISNGNGNSQSEGERMISQYLESQPDVVMDDKHCLPQLFQPCDFTPAMQDQQVLTDTQLLLKGWEEVEKLDTVAAIDMQSASIVTTNENWSDHISIVNLHPFPHQEEEKGTDTSNESVWDLVRFDAGSHVYSETEGSVVAMSEKCETISTKPIQPVKSSIDFPSVAPIVELHGTFNEDQLLEKLRVLRQGKR